MGVDTRWQQRFQNYCSALISFERSVEFTKKAPSDMLEMAELGLIKSFEIVYELSWNCMKDYCEEKNKIKAVEAEILGSKDAVYFAEKYELIDNKALWDGLIKDRIKTVHTYDGAMAHKVAQEVIHIYHPAFLKLQQKFNELKNK